MNNVDVGMAELADVNSLVDAVTSDCMEMAGLRSEYSIDKFTVATEGPFLAHRFHILMRQYSLTLSELRRLIISRERIRRRRSRLVSGETTSGSTEFADLDVAEMDNEEFLLDIDIENKRRTISRYEQCRLELIRRNGGRPITDKQWNDEEPEYWEWRMRNLALEDFRSSRTGVSSGVFRNVRLMAEQPLLSDKYKNNMIDSMIAANDILQYHKIVEDATKQLGELPELKSEICLE